MNKSLLLSVLLCAPSFGAYTFIASAIGAGGITGTTTSAIDSTGGDLAVACVANYAVTPPTLTDSKSNTWVAGTNYSSGDLRVRQYYSRLTSVGASHTITISGGNIYGNAAWIIVSGSVASPLDQQNSGSATSTTVQTGSVTPTENDELLTACVGWDGAGGTFSINSSFTLTNQHTFTTGDHYGLALSYLIQTTAGAVNPTWSNSASIPLLANIATFKAAAAAGATGRRLGVAF